MKFVFLRLIDIYQKFLSPFLKQVLGCRSFCRFNPTCSEYASICIKKEGVLMGLGKFFIRLLHCQPFSSVGCSVGKIY